MPYETFIQEFRQRTGLTSNLESIDAARAVVETLGECLPGILAGEVESHLPCALRPRDDRKEWSEGERLSVSEFLLRIARREGADESTAFCHTQAVLQMLGASLGLELTERVRAELPREFDEFWGADPAQAHMHQSMA
jgi:uncharacterized protein (DUF2267 family)